MTILLALVSCEKETDILTQGELIAKELSSVTEEHKITLASIYAIEYYDGKPYLFSQVEKEIFSIEGTFIVVNQQYFNLEQLERFKIIENESPNYIKIYF